MENLLNQAFDITLFRQHGHQLIDQLADYLQKVSSQETSVLQWQSPDEALNYWTEALQKPGMPLSDLLSQVLTQSMHLHHPAYIGHQVSAPAPLAALTASAVGAILNNGMAVYEMGPVATAMERIVIRHLADAIGYGSNAGGLLTSGGTLANLTALLTARAVMSKANVWEQGSQQPYALMVSEEAHYCVDRAARIMGWGTEGIIKVPADEQFRMRTDLLESCLEQARQKGLCVIAIVGSACTTSTGTYDDLEAIGHFAQKHKLWFHVDGAHGGAVVYTRAYKHLTKGIALADSVVVDYHKMLLTPALTTALVYKEEKSSWQTFAQRAQYLWNNHQESDWFNMAKRTFECTKLMMSLRVYLLLQQYGVALFDEYVSRMYALSRQFAERIAARPGFELAVAPDANIVCFRYRATNNPNWLNEQIRSELLQRGDFYIVQTQLRGQVWLRVTLMNPFSSEDVLSRLLQSIEDHAKALLANTALAT